MKSGLSVEVPPAAPSLSSLGKMFDGASAKNDLSKVFKVQRKIKISSWEGIDMIEQILHSASGQDEGERSYPLQSSPRVNPHMIERDFKEDCDSRTKTFLTSTANEIEALPAKQEEKEVDDSSEVDSESTPSRMVRRKRKEITRFRQTAPFLSPERPEPGIELLNRGAEVGKYCPKYKVVERVGPSVKLAKAKDRKELMRKASILKKKLSMTRQSVSLQSVTYDDLPLSGTVASMSPTMMQKKQSQTPEPMEWRKHDVHDVSSAFKSKVPRSTSPPHVDVDYWPYPQPGGTMYHPGKIHSLKRETMAASPGCAPAVTSYFKDKYEPHSILQFSKSISRARQKTAIDLPSSLPPQVCALTPNVDALSTKPRIREAIPFEKQCSRPPPKQASSVEPLDMYAESVVTIRKRGFVDLSRMLPRNEESIYMDESTLTPLQPNFEAVLRSSPKVGFSKVSGERTFTPKRGPSPEYYPDDLGVRRHTPNCFFERRSRETPVPREGSPTKCDKDYDVQIPPHVLGLDLSRQISREKRNDVSSHRNYGTDTVYDIPRPKVQGTLNFSLQKGRA